MPKIAEEQKAARRRQFVAAAWRCAASSFQKDSSSPVAPYLQLVQQVSHALRLGRLRVGDRLPAVRDVAAQLAINPNTVLKAYRQLETLGLVEGRPGVGIFIARMLDGPSAEVRDSLRRELLAWLDRASAARLDADGIHALVDDAIWHRSSTAGVA